MDLLNILLIICILWIISFILVVYAMLKSRIYIALAFRYFRRSHKFTLPPSSKVILFEVTAPAFFVFSSGVASFLFLFLFITVVRPLIGPISINLKFLAFICLVFGGSIGYYQHFLLKEWATKYIDRICKLRELDKYKLMVKHLSPRK